MADAPRSNAVIRFDPDGFDTNRSWLMGRQVAGNGFLRAAVAGRGEGPLYCYSTSEASARAFAQMVQGFDPAARTGWIRASQLQLIGHAGEVLYLSDPMLDLAAKARLRVGPARYSICGVTHTTATPGAMQAIADLLSGPVEPWDAMVCTSQAVAATVARVLEAETEMLRWRLGEGVRISTPQLPIIPLGVHCADYAFDEADRRDGRAALGLADDEVAALFVGRLTFSGKHHPFALYRGLQAAAERTGRRLVLIMCGWAPTDAIHAAFATGAAAFAPGVRTLFVDGREAQPRRNAWAAGDLFVSLSDGIQETFGLTPIEAMAAGLPCVVSDWNGYKDTVRDGIDGFRVPTWAPGAGAAGEALSREQQVGENNYDRYLWTAAAATSVDTAALVDRMATLIENPDLRRTMGEAARRRAHEVFDWAQVFRSYQALWADLAARRRAALADPQEAARLARAPRTAAGWLDPFDAFGHYPTRRISGQTRLTLIEADAHEALAVRRAHPLFTDIRLPEAVAAALLARLATGPATVAEAAAAAGIPEGAAVYLAGVLAKLELARLDEGDGPDQARPVNTR